MSYVKIHTYVRDGGQLLIVDYQDFLDHNDLGLCSLAGGYIKIAESFNNGASQSYTSKCNTFYHELVHAILDTMGENEYWLDFEDERGDTVYYHFIDDIIVDWEF